MHKFKFTRKINYLLISLEVLKLNSIDKNNKYLNKNHRVNKFYTLEHINIANKYKRQYSYTNSLILIDTLYTSLHKKKSFKLIQLILQKENLLNIYIKKFNHIYLNNNNYYTLYANNDKTKIHYIAIINLYIIYFMQKNNNILYLTYYLLT